MRRALPSPSTRAASSVGAFAMRSIIRDGMTWLCMSIDRIIACTGLGFDGRDVDFDETAGYQQGAYLHRRARRRRRKEYAPHGVELREVVQVREEHLRLDRVGVIVSGGFEHAADVLEHVARLTFAVGCVIRKRRIAP